MRYDKLHTPAGVFDRLPEEFGQKRRTLRRIENIFEENGYEAIESPVLEYAEVFGKGEDMFRIYSGEGAELALRPDMTPPIARICATAYAEVASPLRFCYTG
ncbi:MAG: ATP phosphoribosyltransferase regulatory subunit, partial [Firmicutes bacterium]|nr:ATP phosphoribosyltransferase regulatory subunit [Bacillota bacterium]